VRVLRGCSILMPLSIVHSCFPMRAMLRPHMHGVSMFQILRKASSSEKSRPPVPSLTDSIQRAITVDPSKIRLPDLDAVIEMLCDRREVVRSQQQASRLMLTQAFLYHSR